MVDGAMAGQCCKSRDSGDTYIVDDGVLYHCVPELRHRSPLIPEHTPLVSGS